jgi:hypothetical protein
VDTRVHPFKAASTRLVRFLGVSAFDRFAHVSGTTFQQLSDKTGIPSDLPEGGQGGRLVRRAAAGGSRPRDELSVVPAIEVQLSNGRRAYLAEFNAHPLRENGCVF